MEGIKMNPVIIGIAGGTGSGKTSVTNEIIKHMPQHVTIVPEDAYYKDFSALSFEDRVKINFDHPNSIDNELLFNHVRLLKDKTPIDKPIYDFKTHSRLKETSLLIPNSIIIVEGILIFNDERLRNLMDIKIFVDTDADIRILRRIERDIAERGRTLNSVIDRYRQMVRPMHIRFVEPTKRFADVIIPEGGHNRIGIKMLVSQMKQILIEKKSRS